MALKDRVDEMLAHLEEQANFIETNKKLLSIYDGNLLPEIEKILQTTLSEQYYSKVKDRLVPINILPRYIDKVSRSYRNPPIRTIQDGSDGDAELMAIYEDEACVNDVFNSADEFTNLSKGYAIEPFVDDGMPKLRVLPFDKFTVMSDNLIDPTKPTIFIKIIGERPIVVPDRRSRTGTRVEQRIIYFAYTDDEFYSFDSGGDAYEPAMVENQGVNKFGVIPFLYGNRGRDVLIPVLDTDILEITEIIPVLFSDLSGGVMFQIFSIIYGIDIDSENLTMSPNAFWSFKSDATRDGVRPEVNTIKPEIDSQKVLDMIREIFTSWLETKGIRTGTLGSTSGQQLASGISKIVDEMDTSEIIVRNQQKFEKDEKRFWKLLAHMHNVWVETGELTAPLFSDNLKVSIEYDKPKPIIDRFKEVETVNLEVQSGYLDPETAVKRLYPGLSEEEVEKRVQFYYGKTQVIQVTENIGSHTHEGMGPDVSTGAGHVHYMNDGSGVTSIASQGSEHQHIDPKGELSSLPTELQESDGETTESEGEDPEGV